MANVGKDELQVTEEGSSSRKPPISMLNEDCLIYIFKFFTIKDRLIAGCGMLYFKKIYKVY